MRGLMIAIAVLFLGIMATAWILAERADPVMLELPDGGGHYHAP